MAEETRWDKTYKKGREERRWKVSDGRSDMHGLVGRGSGRLVDHVDARMYSY